MTGPVAIDNAAPHASPGAARMISVLATLALLAGLALFVLGAAYRSGAGTTYPGSLALSIGLDPYGLNPTADGIEVQPLPYLA